MLRDLCKWIAFSATAALLSTSALLAQGDARVAVFVLAGQSNMEGKARNSLFEHQAKAPETAAQFAHLRDERGWIVRDDVFIKYLGRKGKLTLGYGSRDRTGLELEFGTVLGDKLEQEVLLIKTAWGGHSLYQKFRSPSAGLPSEAALASELAQARARVQKQNARRAADAAKKGRKAPEPSAMPTGEKIREAYGSSYRAMLREVEQTLANCDELFPELAGKELELHGFVWFQGWNDQYGGAEKEYAANMAHFIRDVRKDLGAPRLPFVIGVMGQNGSSPAKGAMKAIQDAQLAMPRVEGFGDNVRAVRTDRLVDRAAEKLYPEWKKRLQEWERTGSDHKYHYLGSAIWFTRIGRALGEAMLELLDAR